jgi:hypothetical protein
MVSYLATAEGTNMSQYEHEQPEAAYIVFSRPVRQALGEAGIDLNDILKQATAQGRSEETGAARLAPDPTAAAGSRALDPVTIVASAALIAALTPAVVRIVEAALRRRSVTRERELVPLIDAKGKPALGPDGQPIMVWRERESSGLAAPEPGIRFRIRAFGIEIDFGA